MISVADLTKINK